MASEPVAVRQGGSESVSPQVGLATWLGLIVVLLAAFMELLDITVVTIALPAIQTDLNASFSQLQWLLAGFQLAFAVGLVTGGRLGDIYGRRRVFILGVLAFTLSSLFCGIAPGISWLVTARVLQGATAAIMFPQVASIIHVGFPEEKRAAAFGALGATIGLAGIAGPLLGGVLINADILGLGWRPIFLINLPVGLLAAAGAFRLVRESRDAEALRLDLVGVAVVTIGLLMLTYPLIQGRDEHWTWWIWALMAASPVVLFVFALHQRRKHRRTGSSLVDPRLFRFGSFNAGLAVVCVFFSGVSSVFLIITVYLQVGFQFTPLRTGLAFLPIAVGTAIGSGFSIPLTPKLGKYVIQIGCAVLLGGIFWLMTTVSGHTGGVTFRVLAPAELVVGIGLGTVLATLMDIALAEARGPSAGSASGVVNTVGQVGNAIGVAILGTIFFGLLGARVDVAADHALPDLRQQLKTAGVPNAVAERVATNFLPCLDDQANASETTTTPPSCRRLTSQIPPRYAPATSLAVRHASTTALRKDFADSLSLSLYYEIAIFGGAFLLVLLIPRRRGIQPGAAH